MFRTLVPYTRTTCTNRRKADEESVQCLILSQLDLHVGLTEPDWLEDQTRILSNFITAVESLTPVGEQKWVRDIIWMPGPLFDEVLKVSPRSKLRFSNMISLLVNYMLNNLWLVHHSQYHI